MYVFAVRDLKSEVFGRPFFAVSLGTAIRSFDDEVNRQAPDNDMYNHSEDFQLFALGKYEDTDATFDTSLPKLLVSASDVKKAILKGVSRV
jgi:hypothetical protein